MSECIVVVICNKKCDHQLLVTKQIPSDAGAGVPPVAPGPLPDAADIDYHT